MNLRTAASQIKSIWIKEKSGFPLFLRFGPAGRSCVLNFSQQREREILCDGRGPFAVQLEIPGAAVVGRIGDRADREERDAVRVADMRDRGRLHIHGERCKARVDLLPPSSVMKASPVTMRPKRTGYSRGCFAAAASAHARSAGSAGNQIDSSHG